MDSDRGFEVVDKRRVHPDDVTEEPAGEAAPPEPAMETAPTDEETAGTLPVMDVYNLLSTTVQLLTNGAWAWLGLVPNPFTGNMDRDLSQAKVAIDSVQFLARQLEGRLSESDQRDLRNLVANLQMNYVQQMQRDTNQG